MRKLLLIPAAAFTVFCAVIGFEVASVVVPAVVATVVPTVVYKVVPIVVVAVVHATR